jgi:leucine efflux protein
MNTTLYLSFLLTSLVVLAIPGPSFAYAVAVGARATREEIAFNALGMGLGGLAITVALAFGASQLIAASPTAYMLLQIIGCAYLIYLGVVAFRVAPATIVSPPLQLSRRSATGAAVQGFIVETANPKAILFYASLVPQFADPSAGDVALQFLVLGGTFVTLQVAWDIALMFGVRHLRSRVQTLVSARFQRFTNKASGFIFISLGIALLLQERPSTSVR